MDSRENENKIAHLVVILRRITYTVQLAPFIYSGILLVILPLCFFASDTVLDLLDSIAYTSPTVMVIFLIESRILKLCKWHRAACLMPLIPQIPVFIDRYFWSFSYHLAAIVDAMVILTWILFLVAVYKVFIAD